MASRPKFTARRILAAAMASCAAAAAIVLIAAPQEFEGRDVLWRIVNEECVPNQLQKQDPKPCALVDLHGGVDKGFAIFKDIRGDEQFLLIPTARISGIESPVILAPDAPNYFADAWDARSYLDELVHQTLPRDDIGLAINSAAGRSQDQMHIHVDCVKPDVHDALQREAPSLGSQWTPVGVAFSGHHYEAMWVAGERLGANNPFKLLANGIPGAAGDMGDRTLVVIGATRANGDAGFILLEDAANPQINDRASGEELLDHACGIASAAPPRQN